MQIPLAFYFGSVMLFGIFGTDRRGNATRVAARDSVESPWERWIANKEVEYIHIYTA